MSRASEPASDPTPCGAIPSNFAATFAGARSVTPSRGCFRATSFVPGAGPGSRSAESGGGLGVGGPEARAT
jgi:hypothetical protein